MTWPGVKHSVAVYPEKPVRYRRRFLRVEIGALLLGATALFASLVLFPPADEADALKWSEWWMPLLTPFLFGAPYLYVASTLVVDSTHVRIRNPFRKVDIPLGLVVEASPGSNLKIRTRDRHYYAWGVEAANVQIFADSYGSQESLCDLINREARKQAAGVDVSHVPSPKYQFSRPDMLFIGCLISGVIMTVLLVTGFHF